MKVHKLTEENAPEFLRLGEEYASLEADIKKIMEKPVDQLSDDDFTQIHKLTEKQVSLHSQRMRLLQ
ncbi:hypothetical protein JVX98_12915 [Ensifer sp. PDNC004]|uniref:hypothetical protein n=1 Tax=Ensifer sp. PDNC004 TaxID=2811423 RepID=UPI001966AA5D|nr:hypothetical protein [Ensifer sp. PDNC004]QRY69124.1 hypothetical protein JVX98_12915 [Ensifer sp. PDNC004]